MVIATTECADMPSFPLVCVLENFWYDSPAMVKSRPAGSVTVGVTLLMIAWTRFGQKAKSCPSLELCCICKHHSYWAKYCPYSWYHQPSPQIFAQSAAPQGENQLEPVRDEQSKLTWIYRLTSSQLLLMSPHTRDAPAEDSSPAEDAPLTEPDDSEILTSEGLLILRELFGEDDDHLDLEERLETSSLLLILWMMVVVLAPMMMTSLMVTMMSIVKL